jgi:hypothetical protein
LAWGSRRSAPNPCEPIIPFGSRRSRTHDWALASPGRERSGLGQFDIGSGLVSRSPHGSHLNRSPDWALSWPRSARLALTWICWASPGLACGAARFNPDSSADRPLFAPDGVDLATGAWLGSARLDLVWLGFAWGDAPSNRHL